MLQARMSSAEWEYEWSPEKKRYYYMDKARVERTVEKGSFAFLSN